MRIVERDFFYTIENVFPENVIFGFTKKSVKGLSPLKSFKKVGDYFGKNIKLAYLKQVHSSQIKFVERAGLYGGDGLFANKERLALMVRTADCLPLYFYGNKYGSIGLIHLGWRPALRGILDNIDTDLSNFKVVVGVGLRRCCFEVGKEFVQYNKFASYLEREGEKLYFDPVRFLKKELAKYRLKRNSIKDINICSHCSTEFYSYRREQTRRRTLSFIVKL